MVGSSNDRPLKLNSVGTHSWGESIAPWYLHCPHVLFGLHTSKIDLARLDSYKNTSTTYQMKK
jgi:hypothetical protein